MFGSEKLTEGSEKENTLVKSNFQHLYESDRMLSSLNFCLQRISTFICYRGCTAWIRINYRDTLLHLYLLDKVYAWLHKLIIDLFKSKDEICKM